MSDLARIHILKKQAGLDDDAYRDLLERETGKRSARALSPRERQAVIRALMRLQGPVLELAADRSAYARKLRALWCTGYWLGVIDTRAPEAMRAFLKRQTGLDSDRFLRDPKDADKAIEALKDWIRRKTANPGLFRIEKGLPAIYNNPQFQVVLHVWSKLAAVQAAPSSTLTGYLIDTFGHGDPERLNGADWIAVHRELGTLYRATLVRRGARGTRRP
ncbi:hypothetical protein GCM10011316_29150 [Roseibium aquae]|uniref:Mu-like prophage protein gp16 n=1 Tax=Roseibium aquae TaxID=1323746 RepID=A0A916TM11_9HYPH|nr:regulatory protein GemA [Roseibium aquae]GGB55250.1 hypothetical protein GCM10011316_29150 [Roseibium aquae]